MKTLEESDEGKKRRLEQSQFAEEVRPIGPAEDPLPVTIDMDQEPEAGIREKAKRKAEDDPDDPRAGGEGGAEVVHEGGASSSASRMATGDSPTISYRSYKDETI